jgi:hypothetical protein
MSIQLKKCTAFLRQGVLRGCSHFKFVFCFLYTSGFWKKRIICAAKNFIIERIPQHGANMPQAEAVAVTI